MTVSTSTRKHDAFAGEIEEALRALADPERAVSEKRYLKSELVHLGLRMIRNPG